MVFLVFTSTFIPLILATMFSFTEFSLCVLVEQMLLGPNLGVVMYLFSSSGNPNLRKEKNGMSRTVVVAIFSVVGAFIIIFAIAAYCVLAHKKKKNASKKGTK